jgi:hypothetical protein
MVALKLMCIVGDCLSPREPKTCFCCSHQADGALALQQEATLLKPRSDEAACKQGEHDWSERRRFYSSAQTSRFECMKCGAWGYRNCWQQRITAYPGKVQSKAPLSRWDQNVRLGRLCRELNFNHKINPHSEIGGRVPRAPRLDECDLLSHNCEEDNICCSCRGR